MGQLDLDWPEEWGDCVTQSHDITARVSSSVHYERHDESCKYCTEKITRWTLRRAPRTPFRVCHRCAAEVWEKREVRVIEGGA